MPMTPWSVPQRIGFRFAALVAVMLIFPFPAGFVPGTERVYRVLVTPWEWGIAWFAEAILGISPQPHVFTGSGDTLWHYCSSC